MKKNQFRLTLLLSIIILLFSFCPLAVNASQAKDRKAITQTLEKYNDAVKKYDLKKIIDTLDNKNLTYWYGYPDLQKHIRKLNKKYYSMEILSMKVKGNTAVVTTKVSFYSAYDDCRFAMKSTFFDYNGVWSGQKTLKRFSKYLKDVYPDNLLLYQNDPENFKTQFIFTNKTKIPLVKVNGKWKIQKVTKRMQWQMDATTSDFIKDFLKNPKIMFD